MASSQRAAKLLLNEGLIREAESMQIDISRAAEAGIARAVEAERRAKRWAEENAEIVRNTNDYLATHGLPLQKHRVR